VTNDVHVRRTNSVVALRIAARRAVAGGVRRARRTRHALVAENALVRVAKHFVARRIRAVLHVAAGVRVTGGTRRAHIARHVMIRLANDGVALGVTL
jgi:hypothetical protein